MGKWTSKSKSIEENEKDNSSCRATHITQSCISLALAFVLLLADFITHYKKSLVESIFILTTKTQWLNFLQRNKTFLKWHQQPLFEITIFHSVLILHWVMKVFRRNTVYLTIKCASKINSMSLNADSFMIFFCSLICFIFPDNFLLIRSILFSFCLFSFPLCFLFLGKVFCFVLIFTFPFFWLVPPTSWFSSPVITSLYVAINDINLAISL